MIRVLLEHAAQAVDRLGALAVAEIDTGFREQLIGIAFERRRRGSARPLRYFELDLVVGVELELVVAERRDVCAAAAGDRDEGIVVEQLVIPEIGLTHFRDVDGESRARADLVDGQPLHQLAGLVVVPAIAVDLRETARRLGELRVVAHLGE